MALQNQIILVIISYIIFIHSTQSDIIDCLSSATEPCNCPNTPTTPESCTLLCNNIDTCRKKTLNCRSGDPCSIYCSNRSSCTDAIINSNSATNFNITCDGINACKDIRIECGTGHCRLHCNTQTSCLDIDWIDITNTQSFQCTGSCPLNSMIPPPFSASPTSYPTETSQSPSITTSYPTPNPTPNPTLYPTFTSQSPSITTLNPTLSPTLYPTKSPSKSPTISPSKSPTKYPTLNPSKSPNKPMTLNVTPRPTSERMVQHSSLVPTGIEPTMEEKEITGHVFLLDDTCWIVIGICTTIVICVCLVAFGLVYLNHKHTQKMLNTYLANINSTKNENKFHINNPPSMILNPYQLASMYDSNPLAIHPNMNASFGTPKLAPNLNAKVSNISINQSYPPSIMQYNNNINNISPPSINNISPPSNNNNNINNSLSPNIADAISIHNDEGTNTNNSRKVSDMPALPQQIDDTMNRIDNTMNRKQSLSQKIPQQRMHHRHRTSLHMTPAGYMDEKFVTKKHKKRDSSSVSIVMPAPSTSNIHHNNNNISNAHSMVTTPNINIPVNREHIELVKLNEKHNKNDTNTSLLTFVEIYDDRKSMDVDDIEIQSETRHVTGVEIIEMKDENSTDTDLSKELFASHSPTRSSIKKNQLQIIRHKSKSNSKSKSKSNSNSNNNSNSNSKHKNKNNNIFYHSIGSLPVLISANNSEYKNNFQKQIYKNEQIRSNSAILAPDSTYESSPEPLQLPLLLHNNNIISPLKEHSESTQCDECSESKQINTIEREDNDSSTYSSSHQDTHNSNNYYNNKYYNSPSHTYSVNSMNTRYTKHTQSIISDLDSNDDDNDNDNDDDDDEDTYIEIKPMSEKTIQFHNENIYPQIDDEYAYIEKILQSVEENMQNVETSVNESETSINNNNIDDEIILYHANKLMNLITDEDSHKKDKNSISMFV